MKKKKTILSDHKRIGKKFIPPAKHLIGFTELPYIERILPEIVWIGFFLKILGDGDGIKTAIQLGKFCSDESKRADIKGFPLNSSFRNFKPENWGHIIDLARAQSYREIRFVAQSQSSSQAYLAAILFGTGQRMGCCCKCD
jgi:hypothetical protein